MKQLILSIMFGSFFISVLAQASDVEIKNVHLKQHASTWSADVTLKHDDSGWEHYADAWRLLDASGKLLGTRVLYHPHVNEQPFTRSLSNIKIPQGINIIFAEAHDKKHGWSSERVKIDLNTSSGDNYKIQR